MKYLHEIWDSRYFWLHLTRSDLRTRFRRSRIGLLWALMQPLSITVIISIMFGQVFRIPSDEYAPYIFSGLIIWEFVFCALSLGCQSFFSASAYIRQKKQPIIIYPLRNVLCTFTVFLVGLAGLVAWSALVRRTAGWVFLLAFPPAMAIYLLIAWALAVLSAFLNTRFRDFQYLAPLVLQALWFLSPIFLEERLYVNSRVGWLLSLNPVTHVMNLVRLPLLHGRAPAWESWLFALGLLAVLWILAFGAIRRHEDSVVFFL